MGIEMNITHMVYPIKYELFVFCCALFFTCIAQNSVPDIVAIMRLP